jgi:hypothetical protein
MVYTYVSVKSIIAKVITDLGIQEENIPISDMINWSGEALEKIRAIPSYNHKVTGKDNIPLIPINNYQAVLPMDCHTVLQVIYTADQYGNSGFQPMKYSTGSFEGRNDLTVASDSSSTFVPATSDLITLVMRLYDYTYAEAVTYLNDNSDETASLSRLLGSNLASGTGTTNQYQLEYKINNGYIKVNQQTGYLMVAYYAIETDDDGYPMIPDDQSFTEAIYWYINMKIKYIEWSNGRIRDAIYHHAEGKWQFYVKQAYGRAMMPGTIDEMESFKNTWVRLIPNINGADSFLQYIDNQEMIKNFR